MVEVNQHGYAVGPIVPGWQIRPVPQATLLPGRYVDVVALTESHHRDVYDSCCGAEDSGLWTYRPVAAPQTFERLREHLDDVVNSPGDLTFALVPREGERAGSAAGIASYLRIAPEHGQIEVGGVLFSRALQRTRAATEAIHLMMRHAFEDLGYRRFEWKCDSLNDPSRRAADRLGFRHEGRFRNHLVVKGRNRDTDWFSVVSEEWPVIRDVHERWLAPDNFDEEGQQRHSLSSLMRLDEAVDR